MPSLLTRQLHSDSEAINCWLAVKSKKLVETTFVKVVLSLGLFIASGKVRCYEIAINFVMLLNQDRELLTVTKDGLKSHIMAEISIF